MFPAWLPGGWKRRRRIPDPWFSASTIASWQPPADSCPSQTGPCAACRLRRPSSPRPHCSPTIAVSRSCSHGPAPSSQVPIERSHPESLTVSTGSACEPTYVAAKGNEARSWAPRYSSIPPPVSVSGCRPTRPRRYWPKRIGWLPAEALPPSLFAQGRRVQVPPPAGQRLGVEQIESASGGPFAVGLHDQQWQRSCELERDGVDGGALRCWPPAARPRWGRFLLYGGQTSAQPRSPPSRRMTKPARGRCWFVGTTK